MVQLECPPLTGPEVYVDAASCDPDRQCGTADLPFCAISPAVLATATLPAGTTSPEVRVAATAADQHYSEIVRLPAGVSLRGGYGPGWTAPTGAARTAIRAPAATTFQGEGIGQVDAGSTVRSTLNVGMPGSATGPTTLSRVRIEFPYEPEPLVTFEMLLDTTRTYLTTGIHLHGGATVTLEASEVVGGEPVGMFRENTEGVYVSGEGDGVVTVRGSTIRPPGSERLHSNGIKVDRNAQGRLRVCRGAVVEGGRAAELPIQSSSGLLIWGGTEVIVSDACQGDDPALPAPVVRGGIAGHSFGLQVDAPAKVSLDNARLSGIELEAPVAAWPQVSDATALAFDPLVTSQVTVSGASLVGLRSELAAQAPPPGAALYGVRAVASGPVDPASLDVQLNGAQIAGQQGVSGASNACSEATGALFQGPDPQGSDVGTVRIGGGSQIAGGGACGSRTGMEIVNFHLDVAASDPPTRVVGSPLADAGADPAAPCFQATGLKLRSDSDPGLEARGGVYRGGNACKRRVGVQAAGVYLISDVTAQGVSDEATSDRAGQQIVGIEVTGAPSKSHTTIVASRILGGPMTAADTFAPDMPTYAAGVRVFTDDAVEVVDNKSIAGCYPECRGALHAAGVRVDRTPGNSDIRGQVNIHNNSPILGARFVGKASDPLAHADGILVQAYSGQFPEPGTSGAVFDKNLHVRVGPTAGEIRGCEVEESLSRPKFTSGLTAHGGNVVVDGTDTTRVKLVGGQASDESSGAAFCHDPAIVSTQLCDVIKVSFASLAAMHSPGRAGLRVRRSIGVEVDAIQATPGENVFANDGVGVRLEDFVSGSVTNSYFFGVYGPPTGGNRACSLALGGEPSDLSLSGQKGALVFAHNACVAGATGDARALFVNESRLMASTPGNLDFYLTENIVATVAGGQKQLAWQRARGKMEVDAFTMVMSGNRLFVPTGTNTVMLDKDGFSNPILTPPCSEFENSWYQCTSGNLTELLKKMGANGASLQNTLLTTPTVSASSELFRPEGWVTPAVCSSFGSASNYPLPGASVAETLKHDFHNKPRDAGKAHAGPQVCTP